ncbi:MAG: helix-turn-helix transcriptional regulator [Clostridia bacterium]|nr:helix-turn-helix transcriptional regulator [Clostridia bacterium]
MEKKLNYEDGRELFVKKLCKLMNERNLSCQYLSSKIKKNDGYINRIVNGKIDPSFEVLFDIATVLKISVSELFE